MGCAGVSPCDPAGWWRRSTIDAPPEDRHPAALLDAYFAYRWLLDNAAALDCDAGRCALIGESSGATIAAGLALLLRDLRAPLPTLQALAYPMTDVFDNHPSYRERGTGYALDRELMRWYLNHYLPPEWDPRDRYLYPLTADSLAGLPPAVVMTAEFDPLRDEGVAYARKLAADGVSVRHVHAEDQMHGFLMMDRAVRRAGELIDFLADALAAQGGQGGGEQASRGSP